VPGYSYLSASTGIIVAARKAGYKPETIPIKMEKIKTNTGLGWLKIFNMLPKFMLTLLITKRRLDLFQPYLI
jgi:hypothetical protein